MGEQHTLKILNWNTQIASPRRRNKRFLRVRETVQQYQADVICLTEAYPETLPDNGHTVTSDLSGWGAYEKHGARKVILWSRFGWRDVDTRGSTHLPEGRFVSAMTQISGSDVRLVGMCIPYHGYRITAKWDDGRKRVWQGACEYLDALRGDILPQPGYRERTILLGDFNLQIPPRGYPARNSTVNHKREATFDGWHIPTSGETDDAALDKPFIDHIAHTPDMTVVSMQFISRFSTSGDTLSDHNGVFIEVRL